MPDAETLKTNVLHDLRAGMEDTVLMEKYSLSYTELRSLYKDLYDAGRLRPPQGTESPFVRARSYPERGNTNPTRAFGHHLDGLERRVPPAASEDKRESERSCLDVDVPIYEIDLPEIHGQIRDITEKGARLAGIDANVGEVKTLVVLGDTFGEVSPFEFEAKCCWKEISGERTEYTAGFQITNITEQSLHELRKLIALGF